MPNIDEPGEDHHEQEPSEAKDCIHDSFIAGCRHLFRDAERRLSNPDQVQQFREGKQQVLSYLVGQAMKLSRGKANPNQVNQFLRDKLK